MSEKKKLLYVVRYPLYAGFHLKQKFDGQLNAFANLGFEVCFIGFDQEHFYLVSGESKTVIGNTHFGIPDYFHTLLYADYYAVATRVLKENRIDCVYYRSCPAWPSAVSFAREIKKQNIKLICEVPTYLANAKEKSMSLMRSAFNFISAGWKKKLQDAISLYLLIGDPAPEIYHGKPAMNISNGVSLELMPARKPIKDENCIHLLALSSMCYWHGYDRLIRSLAEYKGTIPVKIHLVGSNDGGCMDEWRQLAKDLGVTQSVLFHGEKYGQDLDSYFDLCDVGITGLGSYRQGGQVSSSLKIREYLTRGLPAVYNQMDPMLSELDNDLQLWVTNDSSTPSMQMIIDFAITTRNDETCIDRLRVFAKDHLTWESEYTKTFAKIVLF